MMVKSMAFISYGFFIFTICKKTLYESRPGNYSDVKPKEESRLENGIAKRPEIIAIRKSCYALGTGLSHYILINKKSK
jgi:modified peptide precursor CbpA